MKLTQNYSFSTLLDSFWAAKSLFLVSCGQQRFLTTGTQFIIVFMEQTVQRSDKADLILVLFAVLRCAN